MRIISGLYKGKKILEPKDKQTRPLKDLTKESIFNIINHSNKFKINVSNAIVLDLFSGVGSFGLECLSRGVNEVIFVENYLGVLPILKKNLGNLKTIENYSIIEEDIFNENFLSNFKKSFDIIFLDPPYKIKNISDLLNKIRIFKLLNKNGIIILHRHKDEEENLPINFKIVENKKYGISKIMFISH
jgi:16S rRNA (guanine966-N2)-methyltransferase